MSQLMCIDPLPDRILERQRLPRLPIVAALVRSGATVKQAQVLARHSTPVLTLAVYSHVAMRELTNALEAMPIMVENTSAQGATG